MLLSPFRIRLILAIPMIVCGFEWITLHRGDPWVRWYRTYVQDYPGGPITIDEMKRRLSTIHEYQLKFPGFRYNSDYTDSSAPFTSQCLSRSVQIHYALLMVLYALPLAGYVALSRKHYRAAWRMRRGMCAHCGYDLRAHPVGQNCPECGALRRK
jgi:hypothetical protein